MPPFTTRLHTTATLYYIPSDLNHLLPHSPLTLCVHCVPLVLLPSPLDIIPCYLVPPTICRLLYSACQLPQPFCGHSYVLLFLPPTGPLYYGRACLALLPCYCFPTLPFFPSQLWDPMTCAPFYATPTCLPCQTLFSPPLTWTQPTLGFGSYPRTIFTLCWLYFTHCMSFPSVCLYYFLYYFHIILPHTTFVDILLLCLPQPSHGSPFTQFICTSCVPVSCLYLIFVPCCLYSPFCRTLLLLWFNCTVCPTVLTLNY